MKQEQSFPPKINYIVYNTDNVLLLHEK